MTPPLSHLSFPAPRPALPLRTTRLAASPTKPQCAGHGAPRQGLSGGPIPSGPHLRSPCAKIDFARPSPVDRGEGALPPRAPPEYFRQFEEKRGKKAHSGRADGAPEWLHIARSSSLQPLAYDQLAAHSLTNSDLLLSYYRKYSTGVRGCETPASIPAAGRARR